MAAARSAPADRAPRRTLHWLRASAAVAVFALVAACEFEPRPAEMRYTLAPATIEATSEARDVRGRIERDLAAAFGTPADPHYPRAPFAERGVDPHHPENARGPDGTGEISPAERAALTAANRTAFRRALGEIERGRFESAADELPRSASVLARALAALEKPAPGADARATAVALVDDWYPALAESAELYRTECLACHGVEGGGDGPSSFGLVPRPRDFRHGVFKYTSLAVPGRPLRDDLRRTLEQGIPGTSMPNFQRLSATQREGLVDYVRFLSIRGEVERLIVATWREEDEIQDDTLGTSLVDTWERWERAHEKALVSSGDAPASTPERVARGDLLFHDATKGNCAACHGADGRGDGPAAWKMDVDGQRSAAYLDEWGQPIVPRNLRDGVFRGGSRPIDLYRRIHAGIPGGPMPGLGAAQQKDGTPVVSSDDIWCLVHYVISLSKNAGGP